MNTWHERLKKAMEEAGMSPADLARAVGASTASVSEWTNGITRELKATNSERVCAALKINHRWLILGKGPMRPGVAEPYADYDTRVSPRLAEMINQLDQDHLAKLEEIAELYAKQKDTRQ